MNKNLTFDFVVDKENKTINIKREFDAKLPVVWDAYTKSEILDKWWAPKPWKSKTRKMDFREGGEWLYSMIGPNGEEHFAIARYKKIQPQKKFSVHDAFTDEKGNINKDLPEAFWEISFIDKGESTLVDIHITYEELAQLEEIIKMGFKEGFAMAMENLDELLTNLR